MNKSSEVPNQKKDRKSFKLWVHPLNFSQEELVINPDYFPGLKIGDILEIYRPENPDKKLILQVGSITSVKGNSIALFFFVNYFNRSTFVVKV